MEWKEYTKYENQLFENCDFTNTIFENMNPSGIKYDDWVEDLALNDPFHGQFMKEGKLEW